jgi:hypothetical protein
MDLTDRIYPWPGESFSGRVLFYSVQDDLIHCVADDGLRFAVPLSDAIVLKLLTRVPVRSYNRESHGQKTVKEGHSSWSKKPSARHTLN